MSILIKGMEMPETGTYVLSVDYTDKDKTIFTIAEHTHSGKIIIRYVGEAVSVPTPHGRLIDADALLNGNYNINMGGISIGRRRLNENDVEDAPTIIEAEAEE